MLFGGGATVAPWLSDPRVEIHGPGQSKVIIGEDVIDRWEDYLDIAVASIAANGGRSCINASGVWVPAHGREIAEALAERLAKIVGRPLDDPEAQIAAFTNPTFADQISTAIDIHLKTPGAEELTEKLRGDRLVEIDGLKFLNPRLSGVMILNILLQIPNICSLMRAWSKFRSRKFWTKLDRVSW